MSSKSCSDTAPSGPFARGLSFLEPANAIFPGLAVAGIVGLAAAFLTDHYGGPIMVFVLLLGMTLNPVASSPRFVPGITLATTRVLRIGVALLGARITLDQILSLGLAPIAVVVVGVVATVLFGVAMGRVFGLGSRFGVLTGCAVAICGASAALAIAAVLPKGSNDERDTIFTVIGVTTLSTVAMVLYPFVTVMLDYDDHMAGIFLGGTIHDVAQVVGAGYSLSDTAGDVATYTKLLRVAMLLPVALVVALVFHRGGAEGTKARPPFFLFAFFALIGLNSAGLIPAEVASLLETASKLCLIVAIAALGIKTSLMGLVRVGGPAIVLIVLETLMIAGIVIGLLTVLG
ncbi:putative sulfate exporter family transporter [Marivibrio halodurans]|uniref:Putative sulfate exporter family transporter n=1 Tax=Marivibrio halodurans TaxID=2039722 RepID=A0A8J7SL02_9PROT|nr:putative sulfate exporter family transporter [Marivibrio halodurans]MBP5856533.1 putative sulfate exporter family transporter [Marivibrio halodurans]